MTYDPYALIIHIDGSVPDNPGGAGGIAGIVEFPEKLHKESETIFQIPFDSTTNNRMELSAWIEALIWARNHAGQFHPARVLIITDSQYVSENLAIARRIWKQNDWCNAEGRPIDNADLWKTALSLIPKIGFRVDLEWRKGKSTPVLKEVDRQAKEAAVIPLKRKDRGYSQGKIARAKLHGIAGDMFPARGQEAVIRIYKKDGRYPKTQKWAKIRFEVFGVDTNTYTSKNYAYASLEVESELHRSHLYRVRFNDDSKFPIIAAVIEEFLPK